jgi:transcriptional regulator with XRE-family HTH domain
MQSEQQVKKGEYRRLKPEEVGGLVRRIRKQAGMKQITLAYDARVHERTVQRIERGEQADGESLRRVAVALRLDAKVFVEALYVPTTEEVDWAVKKALAEFTVIEAHGLETLSDCAAVLTTHVFCIDDHAVSEKLADQVAEFKDLVTDRGNVYNDVSHAEKLAACRAVLATGEKLEGYKILYGVYTTEDRLKFKIAVPLFVAEADGQSSKIAQLVVPRTLRGLKKGETTGMVWDPVGGYVAPQTTDDGQLTQRTNSNA